MMYELVLALALVLTSINFGLARVSSSHLVCKNKVTQTCISWKLPVTDRPPITLSTLKSLQSNDFVCGISTSRVYRGGSVFHSTVSITPNTPRKIICKLSDSVENIMLRRTRSTSSDTNNNWKNTVNPQNEWNRRRPRYRGQTQSQYLNIGTSGQQGTDAGKAEAESFYEGSRAIVSGNSGMGQAQSQSNVSPDCEPCYGPASSKTNDQSQVYNNENGIPSSSSGGIWQGTNTKYPSINTGTYPGNLQTPGPYHPQSHGTYGNGPHQSQGPGTPGSSGIQTGGQNSDILVPQPTVSNRPVVSGTQETQRGGTGAPTFYPNVPYKPQGPGTSGTSSEGQNFGVPLFQPTGSNGAVTSGTQGTQTGIEHPGAPKFYPAAPYQPQGPGTPGTSGTQTGGHNSGIQVPQPTGPDGAVTSGTQSTRIGSEYPGAPTFYSPVSYQPQGTDIPGTSGTQTGGQHNLGSPRLPPTGPNVPVTSGTQGTHTGGEQSSAPTYHTTVPYQPQGPETHITEGTQGTQTAGQYPLGPEFQQTGSYQPSGTGTSGTQWIQPGSNYQNSRGFQPVGSYQPQGTETPGTIGIQGVQTGSRNQGATEYQSTGPYQPQGSFGPTETQGTQPNREYLGTPGFHPISPYQPGQGPKTNGVQGTQTVGLYSGGPTFQSTGFHQPLGPGIQGTQAGGPPSTPGIQSTGIFRPQLPGTGEIQRTQGGGEYLSSPGFPLPGAYQPQGSVALGPSGMEGTQVAGQNSGRTGPYDRQGPGTSETQWKTGGQNPSSPEFQTRPYQNQGPGIPETGGPRGTQTADHNAGVPGFRTTGPFLPQGPGTGGTQGTSAEGQHQVAPGYQPTGPDQPRGPGLIELQGARTGGQYPDETGFQQTVSYQPQAPGTTGTQWTQSGGFQPTTIYQPSGPGQPEMNGAPGFQPTTSHQPQSHGAPGTSDTIGEGQHSGIPVLQPTTSYQPITSGSQKTQTGREHSGIPLIQATGPYQPVTSGTQGTPAGGGHPGAPTYYPTVPYQPQGTGTHVTGGTQGTQTGGQHSGIPLIQPTGPYQPVTSGTQGTLTGGGHPGAPTYYPTVPYQPQGTGTHVTGGTPGTQTGVQYPVTLDLQPSGLYQPQGPGTAGSQVSQTASGIPGSPGFGIIGTEGSGRFPAQVPGNWGSQASYPYASNVPGGATGPQMGGNVPPTIPATGESLVPGLLQTNYPGVDTVAAGSNGEDDGDSQAAANVQQGLNETTASASSQGRHKAGKAQTQVSGVYSGSGSFSAKAQIDDENKGAQSQVNGNKQGATSSSQGRGSRGQSQAKVQLGSETGAILTESQSGGTNYLTNTQVQGSYKGGMADSQANGPGMTSSQAQIGFTPYQSGERDDDNVNSPFMGGGSASSQSGSLSGQSQTQIHGKFRYGISYNGAAQAASGGNKDSISKNRVPFNPINVFDTSTEFVKFAARINNTNLEANTPSPSQSQDGSQNSLASKNYGHTHSDHHEAVQSYQPQDALKPNLESNKGRKTFNGIVKQEPTDDYEDDTADASGDLAYDNYHTDETQQAFTRPSQSSNKKTLTVNQSNRENTQHIILGSLDKHDAEIIQDVSDEIIDDGRIYEGGEVIPGTQGYAIPMGFRGHLSSVSSKDNTHAHGGNNGYSQAQTVNLTPGNGKVTYTNPRNSYGTRNRYVQSNNLRSLTPRRPPVRPETDRNYVSVSKSVSGSLDGDNNLKPQYSHTYYTKSSTCGYFTFTCNIVNGSNGRTKVCKPKQPTNPDGTPIQC